MALSWDLLRPDEKEDVLDLINMLFSHILDRCETLDSLWQFACGLDNSLASKRFDAYKRPALDRILEHHLMDRYADYLEELYEFNRRQ